MFPYRKENQTPTDTVVDVLPTVDDALRLNKVEQWRYDGLFSAGYTQSQSLMLAINRTVDLHEAVNLAHAAGPGLAYRIVA